jgi:hypothetical protein
MKKSTLIILAIVFCLLLIGGILFYFVKEKNVVSGEKDINTFVECQAAGNPVMESYPRACRAGDQTFTEVISTTLLLTETEARLIAEQTCIKGEETLASGTYNEGTKTWWFDANLNPEREGCNPACVVNVETQTAEINWRCTGLIIPNEATTEIQKLFAEKYPKYAATVSVKLAQETESHARGSVIFETGAPGGIFLATKIEGLWQIVFDGNGQISCDLSRYGFPDNMLADCSNK